MYGQAGWDEVDIDGRDANGNFPEESDRWGRCSYTSNERPQDDYTPSKPHYKWMFYDDEALITSEIFQRLLGQALEFKNKEIAQLRQELMNRLFSDL